jgi:hypothetical protein
MRVIPAEYSEYLTIPWQFLDTYQQKHRGATKTIAFKKNFCQLYGVLQLDYDPVQAPSGDENGRPDAVAIPGAVII